MARLARIVDNVIVETHPAEAKFHDALGFVEVDDSIRAGMRLDPQTRKWVAPDIPGVHSPEHLKTYVHALAMRARISGTVQVDGHTYQVDIPTKVELTLRHAHLTDEPHKKLRYKLANGSMIDHDLDHLKRAIAIITDHAAHVDVAEAKALAGIDAGKVSSEDHVDDQFDPVIPRDFARHSPFRG